MAIKPTSGPRCMRHQIECRYNCGWCGKPICDECIESANGKKYCDKCFVKKQQMTPVREEAPKVAAPKTVVRNIDPTLDPKIAEQKRAELQTKKPIDPKIFEL